MGYPDWQTEQSLSDLISSALESSGIPVVSNPVLRYSVLAPPPTGVPGLWGTSAFGGGVSDQQAINNWDTTVGRTSQACRVYFQDNGAAEIYTNSSQFQGDLLAAFNLGLVAVISYQPTHSGTRTSDNLPSLAQMQTDQDTMKASLNSIIACGFPAGKLRVVMRHEANLQSNGVSPAQYLNMYNGLAAGGLSNYTALHAICPVYSIMLGNQPGTSPQLGEYPPVIPILPANACDALLVDWYGKPYTHNQWLGGSVPAGQTTWDAVARAAGVPLGVGEYGGFANLDLPTTVRYLLAGTISINGVLYTGDPDHSMQAVMDARLNDGLTNAEVIAFQNYGALPVLPTGVPAVLAALHDALASTASVSIAAGASQVLTPLAPSPVAAYASATGMSYDVTVNAVAVAAGSTNPVLTVTFDWFNDDDAAALPVSTQKWSLPIGEVGTTGAIITGRGPQAGKYWRITVKNNNNVGCVFSLQGNSTGRGIPRHDWRWAAPTSVSIPTYTLPGGDGNGLSLGAVSSAPIGAGNTKSWLFSLYAGEVGLRFAAFGAAANNTVKFSVFPQPPGRWTTVPVYAAYLPTGGAAFQQQVNDRAVLPRGPCEVTVTNSDANAITIDIEIVALEPGSS
jgi:hypothetical protein